MTKTIPNEKERRRQLSAALERIRLAMGFPTKNDKLSFGSNRKNWVEVEPKTRQVVRPGRA